MFGRALATRSVWTFPLVLLLYAVACVLIGFAAVCKILLGKLRS